MVQSLRIPPRSELGSEHVRCFAIGGLSVQVESDLPFNANSFLPKFETFIVQDPDDVTVVLRHHYSLPELDLASLGPPVYRQPPWGIYQVDGAWIYFGIAPGQDETTPFVLAVYSEDHSRGDVYHPNPRVFERGEWATLTGFPSDQMILSHVLANHQACYIHSSGLIINDQGLLFVGRSGAGKSTILKMVLDRGQVLCDDRNIIRHQRGEFWAYGSWSHGELPIVSNACAPLGMLLFLEQATENRLHAWWVVRNRSPVDVLDVSATLRSPGGEPTDADPARLPTAGSLKVNWCTCCWLHSSGPTKPGDGGSYLSSMLKKSPAKCQRRHCILTPAGKLSKYWMRFLIVRRMRPLLRNERYPFHER